MYLYIMKTATEKENTMTSDYIRSNATFERVGTVTFVRVAGQPLGVIASDRRGAGPWTALSYALDNGRGAMLEGTFPTRLDAAAALDAAAETCLLAELADAKTFLGI